MKIPPKGSSSSNKVVITSESSGFIGSDKIVVSKTFAYFVIGKGLFCVDVMKGCSKGPTLITK